MKRQLLGDGPTEPRTGALPTTLQSRPGRWSAQRPLRRAEQRRPRRCTPQRPRLRAVELTGVGSPVRRVKKNAAPSLCPLEEEAPAHLLGDIALETFAKRGRWMARDRD